MAYDFSQLLGTACHRHDEVAAIRVNLELARTIGAQRLHSGIQVTPPRHCELEPLATDLGLQFIGGALLHHTPLLTPPPLLPASLSLSPPSLPTHPPLP